MEKENPLISGEEELSTDSERDLIDEYTDNQISNQKEDGSNPKEVIRNQGVDIPRTENKLKEQLKDAYEKVKQLYPRMGKIVLNDLPDKGIGSGLIFKNNLFVTAKHCLEDVKDLSQYSIAFGEGKTKAKPRKILSICKEVPSEEYFPNHAQKLAVYELNLILQEKNDYSNLLNPDVSEISSLYLFSYKTGTHLKVSHYPNPEKNKGYFVVRHRSGPGSSGGVYLNKLGEIVGIHLGSKEIIEKNDDQIEHIALDLWNSGDIPNYIPEKNPIKNRVNSAKLGNQKIKLDYKERRYNTKQLIWNSWKSTRAIKVVLTKKNGDKIPWIYGIFPDPHSFPKVYPSYIEESNQKKKKLEKFYADLAIAVYNQSDDFKTPKEIIVEIKKVRFTLIALTKSEIEQNDEEKELSTKNDNQYQKLTPKEERNQEYLRNLQ